MKKQYIEPKTIFVALNEAEFLMMTPSVTGLDGASGDNNGPNPDEIDIDSKRQGMWGWTNASDN